MPRSTRSYAVAQPMRIQARKGSKAERRYYEKAALPGRPWPMPKEIAEGIDPSPLDDLIYHGGKVVAQMEFQNIYVGSAADWSANDVQAIDRAITLAMQDRRLNNVIVQYFPGVNLSADPRPSFVQDAPKPDELDEAGVQAAVKALYDQNKIARRDLETTIFNLVLPAGTILRIDDSSSLDGLGGYHGSVRFKRDDVPVTLYYSANVYSQMLPSRRENGIVVFNRPWKNVVGTLYHELNEFRTDPDVNDAIRTGNNDFLGWTSRRGHECGDQPVFVADPLTLVFKEVTAANKKTRIPVQFMFSNAVHGAEGPVELPVARKSVTAGRHEWR